MYTTSSLLLAVAGSALVAAAPSARRSVQAAPCAQISEQYAQGALAHECLQSMPFNPQRGTAFVEDVRKYLQWQSNADLLKNPPTSYLGPPVDFWGGLDYLQQQASLNKFASQFEFDTALSEFFASVNDGHLSILPCSYMPFAFTSHETLVSISDDGLELPQVYTFNDAKFLQNNTAAVSPVVSINGVDVVSHLESLAQSIPFQDPDARYNNLFLSRNRFISQDSVPGGFSLGLSGVWPGVAGYTLGYANGTTSTSEVQGVARNGEFEFADGWELYKTFCLPTPPSTSTPASSSSPTPTPGTSSPVSTPTPTTVLPAPTGYPKAAVRDDNNLVAGYLLDEPELKDTAVLSVPTFGLSDVEGGTAIVSDLVVEFLNQAVDAGKTKIIIDMSGNPGGDTNYAFDLFRIFFPDSVPYWSTRFRAHDALKLIEKVGFSVPQDPDNEIFAAGVNIGLFAPITPDQDASFDSLQEFYGPYDILGANMTSPSAMNFDLLSSEVSPIHGFGDIPSNRTTAPFAAEDILIITDGACSSSCPIFTQLMEYEGVKTLSFGGRPKYGPMQAMGGTRGGQVLPGATLLEIVSAILEAASQAGLLSAAELQELQAISPAPQSPLQYGALNVNLRDAYSQYDEDSLMPLQFVYEPAHCRLFYTVENILHPATTWSAAVKAIWGDAECVAGSRF
ncbi:hypothetical protein BDW59DRAFT_169792 [Aspergillus cavernicola]|uniref:Tail specific protease domain-containing protein n=1 Tax=Aspergillus cavernicola TaxID=176166 RepID=A0ABR4IUW1_9EURO